MFKRKTHCQTITEMLSSYLDGCLDHVEQDMVQYHVDICDGCHRELETLQKTVQLLHDVPVVPVPHSFALASAPEARIWDPFSIPRMNWFRIATAAAVISLAVVLTGDLSGFFHTEISPETAMVLEKMPQEGKATSPAEAISPQSSAELEEEAIAQQPPPQPPADDKADAAEQSMVVPITEEAIPPDPSPEDRGIAQLAEGIVTGAGEVVSPTPPPSAPLDHEAYTVPRDSEATLVTAPAPDVSEQEHSNNSWLRPLEIALTALITVLIATDIFFRRNKHSTATAR